MNGQELFKKDGTATGIFFCETCRVVHRDKAKADECCVPRLCACGATLERYTATCRACTDKKIHDKECAMFAKAEQVEFWDGPVFRDGCGHNEGFFDTAGDLMEWIEDQDDDEIPIPGYAWTCDRVPVVTLDLDRILEDGTQEAYDEFAYGDLSGIDKLKAAIDEFNRTNADVVSFVPNYKRVLILHMECLRRAGE